MGRFAPIWEHLWCPEGLALRWRRLPERIGYTVLPVPLEFARRHWEREAAGERRRVAEGWYAKDRPIDDALVDRIVAQQQAAFVVTEASIFYVSAYPDYLQQHDSTDFWWLEVRTAFEKEIRLTYDIRVHFRADQYWLAANTLVDSFLASGARTTPNAIKHSQVLNLPPPAKHFLTEWLSRRTAMRLFRCPRDLMSRWRVTLLDPMIRCELTPLHALVPSPTGETFTCGRMGNWFSAIVVRSGPAFDPSTWSDAAFLAIESKGIILRKTFFDQLTSRAIEFGMTPVTDS